MPVNTYDQTSLYDQTDPYDSLANPRLARRDLFVVRASDQLFNFQAVANNGTPIDVQEYALTAVIQEYELGTTFYPAQIEKIYPVDGIYQLKIDHTTRLNRSRYVYSIIATGVQQTFRLGYGHILVE